MDARKKHLEYFGIINEYQCPGFVDKSCSSRTAPSLKKVGEKGGVR
jgi:hypothetical protein